MEITSQAYKHCDLLKVQGKVDSYTAPDLTKAIEALNTQGRYKIVLDLGKLDYMSSAGFRALLVGQRNCKRYNRGEIVLASVPKRIMDALELTGFTPLFKIFSDITSAVGNF
ncbi:MAG TPA: STAS domain-containing protein [Anaerolineales bacterium]|nr:STAS domain-containing protein [Anaerolineales bacterium]